MDEEKPNIWMPLDIGAYLSDTMHLSTEEHGAYLLMMFAYWKKGGALPNDPRMLARITRMTPDAWSKAQATLMDFFTVDGDGLVRHKRIDLDLAMAQKNKAQAVERAKKAANARWKGDARRTSPSHTPSDSSGNSPSIPEAMLKRCPLSLTRIKEDSISPPSGEDIESRSACPVEDRPKYPPGWEVIPQPERSVIRDLCEHLSKPSEAEKARLPRAWIFVGEALKRGLHSRGILAGLEALKKTIPPPRSPYPFALSIATKESQKIREAEYRAENDRLKTVDPLLALVKGSKHATTP